MSDLLFDKYSEPMVDSAPKDPELKRVSGRIAGLILAFRETKQAGEQWHSEDLHRFVNRVSKVAPASADRVLRQLRKAGQVDYEVVSRSKSLYKFT